MKNYIIKMFVAWLFIIQINDAQTREPILVGAINYDALKGGVERQADENSLSPPKWQHLLPFYANVYNDSSRLVRTKASVQEFVYHIEDSDIMGFKIETAFDPKDIWQADYELQVFTSIDNTNYYLFWPRIDDIGQDWRKVDYWAYTLSEWSAWIPKGTRYLKIRFNRVNNRVDSPQIMRIEINHGEQGKEIFIDEMNDFSKMFYHSENLSFATDNPEKFNVVTANSYSQKVMDQELKYAKYAGIDYMAFIDSPNGYPLNWGADLLIKSKEEVKFCFIIHLRRPELESWENRIKRYVNYFKEDKYQKVLNGRPLVFVFDPSLFSDEEFDQLKHATVQAGLKKPYIVTMRGRAIDACSKYAHNTAGFHKPVWDELKRNDVKIIPNISIGANAECRHENPPPWGSVPWKEPLPTADKVVEYVKEGIKWVKENPKVAEANTILIYSWNEFAEGGAICPTLGEGATIINEFHNVLDKNRNK